MNKMTAGAALIAAACFSTGAQAQQVTMYGLLDLGMAYTTNTNAAGDGIFKMPSLTASLPSRIGFRGSEDLGGGAQAIFALETGISADMGTVGQGNRLFGRAAYVGLKNSYGQLMLGRQVNMTFLATAKSDIIGPNIFSISGLDLYLPNARSDNAIGYLGVFKELTVGATYSFGRDASSAGGPAGTGCAGEVTGNARACRQVTGMLAWDSKTWGASASYDQLRGGPGAAYGLTRAADTDRRISLNGYAVLGQTKIGGGAIERSIDAASDTRLGLYYLGAAYTFDGPWQLDAQLSRLDVRHSPKVSNLAVLRATYFLSRRTAVHASLGRMQNKGGAAIALDAGGTAGAGLSQSGVLVGVRHAF